MALHEDIKFTIAKMDRVMRYKIMELDGQVTGQETANQFRDVMRHIFEDNCRSETCTRENCRWFVQLLRHECDVQAPDSSECFECFVMASNFWNHVNHCSMGHCRVYLCNEIRDLCVHEEPSQVVRRRTFASRLAEVDSPASPTNKMDKNNGVVLELYDLRAANEAHEKQQRTKSAGSSLRKLL